MSSKLQLDICYLSLHRRHLVNAYEVFAGKTLLCDPYLSAFSECEPTIKALNLRDERCMNRPRLTSCLCLWRLRSFLCSSSLSLREPEHRCVLVQQADSSWQCRRSSAPTSQQPAHIQLYHHSQQPLQTIYPNTLVIGYINTFTFTFLPLHMKTNIGLRVPRLS